MCRVHCWNAIGDTQSPKLTNIAELKLFVDDTIHNDLLQEIINKAIVSFHNRLWSCVAAADGHSEQCLNTEWAADIHHRKFETFVLLMKSYANLDLLFVHIQCRNFACLIEKMKSLSLNCYRLSVKPYQWILTHKVWKLSLIHISEPTRPY